MILPPPVVAQVGDLLVLRDDYLPGGTKQRVLGPLIDGADELVYASPAYGYAQVALAHGCAAAGKRAVVFTARRAVLHPRTLEAQRAGAQIVLVPNGYLSVVQARARAYAAAHGARLLPFGFDTPAFLDGLAAVARALPVRPAEVWAAAGSGTLVRALQLAWPDAVVHAIRVGRPPDVGRALLHTAPEPFERAAREPPPFPSCANFDAKAWRFVRQHARPGALFWNVAA